jgi:lysozyme
MELKIGSKGQEVIRLQKTLNVVNNLYSVTVPLKPDGDFGQKTRSKVIDYQRYNKLSTNGIADRFVQKLLGIEILPGIDVSVYQGKIDWSNVIDVEFVFAKASDGKSFRDPTLMTNYNGTRKINILPPTPFGAYHFATYRSTWRIELDNYLKAISKIGKMELPPVLDAEERHHNLKPKQILEWTLYWLDAVQKATGRLPVIYTYPSYFEEYLAGGKGLEKYPLWIAQYGVNQPTVPHIWKEWTIWQWSSQERIGGIKDHVDANWIVPNGIKLLMSQ